MRASLLLLTSVLVAGAVGAAETYQRPPKEIRDVLDDGGRGVGRSGEKVETLASQPLTEQVPINGVRTGPRDHSWQATASGTSRRSRRTPLR